MERFDIKEFLTENKLTNTSKRLDEADELPDKLHKNREFTEKALKVLRKWYDQVKSKWDGKIKDIHSLRDGIVTVLSRGMNINESKLRPHIRLGLSGGSSSPHPSKDGLEARLYIFYKGQQLSFYDIVIPEEQKFDKIIGRMRRTYNSM